MSNPRPDDDADLLLEINRLLSEDTMPMGDMDIRAAKKSAAGVDMPEGDVDIREREQEDAWRTQQAGQSAALRKLLELMTRKMVTGQARKSDATRGGAPYGQTR